MRVMDKDKMNAAEMTTLFIPEFCFISNLYILSLIMPVHRPLFPAYHPMYSCMCTNSFEQYKLPFERCFCHALLYKLTRRPSEILGAYPKFKLNL